MEIFRTISGIQTYIKECKSNGQIVGFCPTMGALHEGHLSLVKSAVESCDITVASIFVNPTQFNNHEDLEKYPRDEKTDIEMLNSAGCDAVFIPDACEIYPNKLGKSLTMNFGALEERLEGAFRPGHFSGVGLVVSKLFNIVQPEIAFFGQKDLQQLAIIRKLVTDLNFSIDVRSVDTVREPSGLAMSSRNRRFQPEQFEAANLVYQALKKTRAGLKEGESVMKSLDSGLKTLSGSDHVEVEYFELIDPLTFESIDSFDSGQEAHICAAAHVHGVRLIDNLRV